MAEFEAPSGPPPPKVPEGWIVRWNDQYKEWFYVNTFTKKSQWDKPREAARPPPDYEAPPGPPAPPSYSPGDKPASSDVKKNPYEDTEDEDAKLARRLQEEEDAKTRSAGHSAGPAGAGCPVPYPNQVLSRPGDESKSRGLLGKIFGGSKKHGGSSIPQQAQGGGYGFPQHGSYQSPQPAGYGGYSPQVGYGGYPPQAGYYQQAPPGGYYGGGGYAPQQQYQSGRPGRSGGGLGMAGGAALGLGAGLVGGMLLENAIEDHDQDIYQQGFDNGEMADGGGGDFAGGDMGDF